MAFNFEDSIPKGYIKEEFQMDGCKVITYRNPNPDPKEQEEGLNRVARILMKGYRRHMAQERAGQT